MYERSRQKTYNGPVRPSRCTAMVSSSISPTARTRGCDPAEDLPDLHGLFRKQLKHLAPGGIRSGLAQSRKLGCCYEIGLSASAAMGQAIVPALRADGHKYLAGTAQKKSGDPLQNGNDLGGIPKNKLAPNPEILFTIAPIRKP